MCLNHKYFKRSSELLIELFSIYIQSLFQLLFNLKTNYKCDS